MMSKKLLGLLSVLLLVSTSLGATYILKYKDGRTAEVEKVTKVKEGYQVVKGGISYLVKADEIASVEERATPTDEYKARLAKIDKTSAAARYKLGRWAYSQKLYDLAVKELETALKIKPDHAEAKLMLPIAQAKAKAAEGGDEEGGDENGKKDDTKTGDEKKIDKLLIPSEDIYRLRLLELKRTYRNDRLVITERTPIQFRDKVLRRFINAWQGRGIFEQKNADRKFLAAGNRAQAAYMLEVLPVDSPLLNDIRVTRDPEFIIQFERTVWPLVKNILPGAFSKEGHAGLRLIGVQTRDPRLIYSNFVLLDGYTKGRWRMIDRGDPQKSLLLNWGLPRDLTKIKNPQENYTPVFKSRDDAQYKRVFQWISNLETPHPKYNLKYKPPYENKLNFGGASGLGPKDEGDDDKDEDGEKEDDENDKPLPS